LSDFKYLRRACFAIYKSTVMVYLINPIKVNPGDILSRVKSTGSIWAAGARSTRPYKGPDDQQPYRCQSYTVRQGDTLNTLASQYGVSVSSLASANPDIGLKRGQRICIPVGRRR